MNPTVQAIYRRPALALLAVIGVCIGPACNLTIEEWKDAVDASKTTVFQPELVIGAWFSSVTNIAIAVFAYLNSPLNNKP